MSQDLERERRAFSLTAGGPFGHLLTRLHLRTPDSMRRCWWIAILAWLPMMLAEGVRVATGAPVNPILRDLSMHVRFLIALPLLLSSEPLLEGATRSAISSLYYGGFCDRASLDRIVERGERLRDSSAVEAICLGIALLGGQLVLWKVFGTTGWIHGGEEGAFWSFPRVWYAIVALPVFQFVMFRWCWRWLVWSYMLARISRLPLVLLATHPDGAAGLACLARPMSGFSGFVLAISALLAAAWSTQVLEHRTSVQELLVGLGAFLLIVIVVAAGPLLPFCGHLFRARRRTLAQYGDFSRDYVEQFHEKWIEARAKATSPATSPLGTPDIQSLNDLGSAFQTIVKTRVFVFGPRNVLAVWFAGLLPMVPLFASTLTIEQVLKRIVVTVLGGIPI